MANSVQLSLFYWKALVLVLVMVMLRSILLCFTYVRHAWLSYRQHRKLKNKPRGKLLPEHLERKNRSCLGVKIAMSAAAGGEI